jgi:hypothetical protein
MELVHSSDVSITSTRYTIISKKVVIFSYHYDLFGGAVNPNNDFNYFYFLILSLYTTTCFSPYEPSSCGIYSHLWNLLRLQSQQMRILNVTKYE